MKRRTLFGLLGAASVAPLALAIPTKKFPNELCFFKEYVEPQPLVEIEKMEACVMHSKTYFDLHRDLKVDTKCRLTYNNAVVVISDKMTIDVVAYYDTIEDAYRFINRIR